MRLAIQQFPLAARQALIAEGACYPGGRNPRTCRCIFGDLLAQVGVNDYPAPNADEVVDGLETYTKRWIWSADAQRISKSARGIINLTDDGDLSDPATVKALLQGKGLH